MTGPKADDEEELGATHTVTPAYVGVGGGSGPAAGAPDSGTSAGVPAPGDVISGKYRIEECLGRGGMGMVFRAAHLLSDKRVALKWMLRPASDPQVTGRFVREARAAARIDHQNVVDVYDVGEHGGFGYLVMELLRGESLWDRLGRSVLGITQAIDLLLPAMRGVAAAHAAGVIHRDLKPHNVFLCAGPAGEAREAKVLDFGISSFTNADAADPTLTLEGTILGTPAYMSPEQLRSRVKLDPRTDVYSMGVILYEAVTGRVPFEEPTFTSLVLAIANQDPPAPRLLRPEVSVELEAVILRAIARDREVRYPNMEAFIAALEPFASEVRATGPRTAPEMAVPQALGATPRALDAVASETFALAPEPASELARGAAAEAATEAAIVLPRPASPSLESEVSVPPVDLAPRRRRTTAARTGPRWPGVLAIAVIAVAVGWWITHGGQRGAGRTVAASPVPSRTQAASAPEIAAQPAPALAPVPVVAPSAVGTAGAAPLGAPTTARAAESSADPGAKPEPRRPHGKAPQTKPEPGAPTAPRKPAGRSGTLSLDDML